MSFKDAAEHVLKIEAGYVNDPNDSGGETNWGITVAVARANGYSGSMRDMTRTQALDIYKREYWDKLRLDEVAQASTLVAQELFDIGVNCGTGVAAAFFQRLLNVFNRRQRLYADIKVDGRVGPATLAAFSAYMKARPQMGVKAMYRALNSLQGAFYISLAERREKDEEFVFGWTVNRTL